MGDNDLVLPKSTIKRIMKLDPDTKQVAQVSYVAVPLSSLTCLDDGDDGDDNGDDDDHDHDDDHTTLLIMMMTTIIIIA